LSIRKNKIGLDNPSFWMYISNMKGREDMTKRISYEEAKEAIERYLDENTPAGMKTDSFKLGMLESMMSSLLAEFGDVSSLRRQLKIGKE
jgi:hypothetical protein